MENRSHAIAAVTFLIVFSLGGALMYYWLANHQNEPLPYEIVTSESVGGLSAQSEVMFKGIEVGHISHIGFDPHDRSLVVLRLQLEPRTYVTRATYAEVAMRGLTGGSVLELKLGNGSRAPLRTSDSHPARIPLRESPLDSLMSAAPRIVKQLHEVLSNAKQVLDDDNRARIAASLRQVDTATRKLVAIETRLAPTVERLPGLEKNMQRSLADADRLIRAAQAPIRNAAALEASAGTLLRSSRRLSEMLDTQTVPDFNTLSRNLERNSLQLDRLLREMDAKPQSLIFGPPKRPPGPGEPGFRDGAIKEHPR